MGLKMSVDEYKEQIRGLVDNLSENVSIAYSSIATWYGEEPVTNFILKKNFLVDGFTIEAESRIQCEVTDKENRLLEVSLYPSHKKVTPKNIKQAVTFSFMTDRAIHTMYIKPYLTKTNVN